MYGPSQKGSGVYILVWALASTPDLLSHAPTSPSGPALAARSSDLNLGYAPRPSLDSPLRLHPWAPPAQSRLAFPPRRRGTKAGERPQPRLWGPVSASGSRTGSGCGAARMGPRSPRSVSSGRWARSAVRAGPLRGHMAGRAPGAEGPAGPQGGRGAGAPGSSRAAPPVAPAVFPLRYSRISGHFPAGGPAGNLPRASAPWPRSPDCKADCYRTLVLTFLLAHFLGKLREKVTFVPDACKHPIFEDTENGLKGHKTFFSGVSPEK